LQVFRTFYRNEAALMIATVAGAVIALRAE
jgi:hypothetical protein